MYFFIFVSFEPLTGKSMAIGIIKGAIALMLNGCGMGSLLVLVPCFRENLVVICKIGSFLCSLENLLQKNVFFKKKNKFQNGAHLKKGRFLTYFSHFLVTREELQKFLQHIFHSHTYIHVFCSPYWIFSLPILKKNTNLSGMVSL